MPSIKPDCGGNDFQVVTATFAGEPPVMPPAGVYIDGVYRTVPRHCEACGQRFDVGHVIQITRDGPIRHTDCDDPTLAAANQEDHP